MDAAVDLTARLATFLPADRAHALASGQTVPQRADGVVLFADIGGFTPLAESRAEALGPEQGAEEVATWIKRIFDGLAAAVDSHHGSIVSIAGDSLTCWFDEDHRLSAVACALSMQAVMAALGAAKGSVDRPSPRLKVGVSVGQARRFIVGDPEIELFDVISGVVVDRAGAAEKVCRQGDVVIDRASAATFGGAIALGEERGDYVTVTGMTDPVAPDPWPGLGAGSFYEDTVRAWIPPGVYERIQAGHARDLAEFRPIVAEFVGFGGIDYEDADAGVALDAIVRRAQAIVSRNGGTVHDVTMGDKGSYLLAVFGAPIAHGNDIRRAVTAANELRRIGQHDLRIGLHAGRAYAGVYGGRHLSTYAVAGDVVNLAARLMTSAQVDQVLMTASLGASLDRRFVIHPIDPIAVKGRAAPVAVCELVGTAAQGATLTEPRYLLPMVGRSSELEVIDEAVREARSGRGGVLAFSADAGLGKSRLVNATLREADAEGFATFAAECQPQGRSTPYLPWQPIWNAIFGLSTAASDDARREALFATLAAAAPAAVPLAPLMATVLDLPMEDNDATRSMPAQVRKQVLEQVLAGSLRGRAQVGPVCIAIEDLHWVDALSRDLLAALATAIADVPVLLVLSYRPPEDEAPVPVPVGRELQLAELSTEEASELAAILLRHVMEAEPDTSVVESIVDRSDGNPFYLEELVREVAERGGRTADLPTSLENLILQRLDRLSPSEQLTAKVASVIGRRFPTEWLTSAFAGTVDGEHLPDDLAGLRASGLIVADTPPPDEAHLFRHVVVRDVAYKTLGYGARQGLHERLADHLAEQIFPSVELIAYHYAHSANTAREAVYRRLAAEVAIRNGAYADALTHVERAAEIVAGQPEGTERLEQELDLDLLLGSILLVTDGQGSARAKATYDRARELSKELPPGPAVGRAVFGLWTYYLFQGLMGPTAELAAEALALTARSPDPGVRIMAHLAVSQTHMWTGQWDQCIDHYDQVLSLYDPEQHDAYITQYAQNPRFTASNSAFWAEWMLGHPERAQAIAELAIEDARALQHEFTYTIAFLGRPLVAWFRKEWDELQASIGEYLESARRSGNPFYIALSLSLDGCAKVQAGQVEAGLAQLETQFATMQALGSKLVDPLMVSFLGDAYLAAGRLEAGIALLDENIARFARDGQVSMLPDHLRLRALLLLRLRPDADDEALPLLYQAIEIAHSHGASSFELRAALAAERVLGGLGRDAEGRRLVETAYSGFTEGFDDPDLREARAILG